MSYKVAGMSCTLSVTLSNTRISDISLAAFGRKEIEIAEVGPIPPRDNSYLRGL